MKTKTFQRYGRKIEVNDPYILDIIEKTENLKMSSGETNNLLKDYLFSDKNTSLEKGLEKLDLWETIMLSFVNPRPGRFSSISEKYVEKHGLSERVSTGVYSIEV
jgi:hypothetical protein